MTIRWLSLAVLLAGLGLVPVPIQANHDLTCHPPNTGGNSPAGAAIFGTPAPFVGELSSLNMHVTPRADGSADVRGVIHLWDTRPPTVLVPERSGAQASCADTDGDSVAGIVTIEATFSNVRTGERVPVAIDAGAQDLDETGTYALFVTIGHLSGVVDVNVHFAPGRSFR